MSYEILPRLIEKYTEEEFVDIVSPDYLDTVTAQALYQNFAFRRVNTAEKIAGKDVWEHHIKQQLRLIGGQYQNYLRVETTKIDPLVTDYIERQILRTGSGTIKGNGSVTNEKTGSSTTTTENVFTPNTTETKNTTGKTTTEGTDNTDSGETLDRTSTETRNTTDTTTGTTSESKTGDNRQVTAQLPHSEGYNTTGTAGRNSGLPSALDWYSMTTQAEADEETETTGNSNETVTGSGTITTAETGSPTSFSDNEYNSEVNLTQAETTTKTGTETTEGTVSVSDTGSATQTTQDSRTTAEDSDTRERATGRSGRSPQELLDLARNYVLKTNSFKWLCDELNENFVWLEVYY